MKGYKSGPSRKRLLGGSSTDWKGNLRKSSSCDRGFQKGGSVVKEKGNATRQSPAERKKMRKGRSDRLPVPSECPAFSRERTSMGGGKRMYAEGERKKNGRKEYIRLLAKIAGSLPRMMSANKKKRENNTVYSTTARRGNARERDLGKRGQSFRDDYCEGNPKSKPSGPGWRDL